VSQVDGAIDQAGRMLGLLARDYPGAADVLANDALAVLHSWPGLQIELVADEPAAPTGRQCTVAGSYRADFSPPKLQVARSLSRRRRQFTALHEFGHHLQRTDADLATAMMEVDDYERFEDAACDAFASRILIPDELVAGTVGRRGPTASEVVALYRATTASRAACCVRSAERLTGLGAVVLYNGDGSVSFAARHGIIPPARGSDQSRTTLLKKTLDNVGNPAAFTSMTTIAYRNGTSSASLYGQAAWCDDYIVAVLAETAPPWVSFALPAAAQPFAATWWNCETCLDAFKITDRCPKCSQPLCPKRHCGCTVADEKQCTVCFLKLHPARFAPGSSVCRDCA
jgi:IrrE N-terminal-like domain